MKTLITRERLQSAYDYPQYRRHIREVLSHPPADDAAVKLRPYAETNAGLMDIYDESYTPDPILLNALDKAPPAHWLVLTEGWCGDAAFNVPMIAAMERARPDKIQLRLLLRDSNLDLMDAYLSDGARSIPKVIILNQDLQELGTWGPRPLDLHKALEGWKAEGLSLQEWLPKVRAWYDADETRSLQRELTALIWSYS